jgi:hypothetical protein
MRKPHRNCIEWGRERQSKTRSESIRGPIAQDAVDNWLFTDAQRTFVRAIPLKCPDEMRGPETSLTRADWLAVDAVLREPSYLYTGRVRRSFPC